jgi:hypothetical protein
MMLHVRVPDIRGAEHEYILQVLLGDFLGLDYCISFELRNDIEIRLLSDVTNSVLYIADVLLTMPNETWLTESSLPRAPLRWATTSDFPRSTAPHHALVPVLYGDRQGTDWILKEPRKVDIRLDLFGSSFFMLTRYEELVLSKRDRFDRFSGVDSLAYREGFLDRPIVNEYLELLWGALSHLWPNLQRAPRDFRVYLSHDVDWPILTLGLPWKRVVKSTLGDIGVRRDPLLAINRLRSRLLTPRGRFTTDPGNVFDFIMQESQLRGLKSAFYFITDHSGGLIDGTYNVDHPWIQTLLHHIHVQGHEIGLHPSFNTYLEPGRITREFHRLLAICERLGINQENWGGRQHYLRWSNPVTWRSWSQAGLTYDSTLGFADQVGFRCGVCYEFPAFDLIERQILPLRERPLIVMEGTLFRTASPTYMALDDKPALRVFDELVSTVQNYSGDFTLLWHNSTLISSAQKQIYRQSLDILKAKVGS